MNSQLKMSKTKRPLAHTASKRKRRTGLMIRWRTPSRPRAMGRESDFAAEARNAKDRTAETAMGAMATAGKGSRVTAPETMHSGTAGRQEKMTTRRRGWASARELAMVDGGLPRRWREEKMAYLEVCACIYSG
jgi:hypothetical protein